jgi:hypothetical protein
LMRSVNGSSPAWRKIKPSVLSCTRRAGSLQHAAHTPLYTMPPKPRTSRPAPAGSPSSGTRRGLRRSGEARGPRRRRLSTARLERRTSGPATSGPPRSGRWRTRHHALPSRACQPAQPS